MNNLAGIAQRLPIRFQFPVGITVTEDSTANFTVKATADSSLSKKKSISDHVIGEYKLFSHYYSSVTFYEN